MFFPSDQPQSFSHRHRADASAGFTLIELLTVIAIISILAGITIGVVRGVQTRAMIARAQGELGEIASELGQFKLQYGDFPRTDKASDLFDALIGRKGPTMVVLNPAGKSFIGDINRLKLSQPDQIDTTGANVLLDPWENEYHYIYKSPSSAIPSWSNPTFVLFSSGPDGKTSTTLADSKGYPASTTENDNLDNVYPGNEQH